MPGRVKKVLHNLGLIIKYRFCKTTDIKNIAFYEHFLINIECANKCYHIKFNSFKII